MRLQTPISVPFSTSSFIWLNQNFSKKNQNYKSYFEVPYESIFENLLLMKGLLDFGSEGLMIFMILKYSGGWGITGQKITGHSSPDWLKMTIKFQKD